MTRHAEPTAPGAWAERALCRTRKLDMTLNDYDTRQLTPTKHAERLIAYCQQCPTLEPCQQWALTHPDPAAGHVAGGMTPRQRAQARRAA